LRAMRVLRGAESTLRSARRRYAFVPKMRRNAQASTSATPAIDLTRVGINERVTIESVSVHFSASTHSMSMRRSPQHARFVMRKLTQLLPRDAAAQRGRAPHLREASGTCVHSLKPGRTSQLCSRLLHNSRRGCRCDGTDWTERFWMLSDSSMMRVVEWRLSLTNALSPSDSYEHAR
jgi:hypothetical protein